MHYATSTCAGTLHKAIKMWGPIVLVLPDLFPGKSDRGHSQATTALIIQTKHSFDTAMIRVMVTAREDIAEVVPLFGRSSFDIERRPLHANGWSL